MKQTTIRFPDKLYEQIKVQAKECGISVNSYILMWLQDKLKAHTEGAISYDKREKNRTVNDGWMYKI